MSLEIGKFITDHAEKRIVRAAIVFSLVAGSGYTDSPRPAGENFEGIQAALPVRDEIFIENGHGDIKKPEPSVSRLG